MKFIKNLDWIHRKDPFKVFFDECFQFK